LPRSDAPWRTSAPSDWEIYAIDVGAQKRQENQFVGLENPATRKAKYKYKSKRLVCFLNALLQQLFMAPSFRQGVMELKGEPTVGLLTELKVRKRQ
jgi:hypothetical protein